MTVATLDRALAALMFAGGLVLGVWAGFSFRAYADPAAVMLLSSASLFCLAGGVVIWWGARS